MLPNCRTEVGPLQSTRKQRVLRQFSLGVLDSMHAAATCFMFRTNAGRAKRGTRYDDKLSTGSNTVSPRRQLVCSDALTSPTAVMSRAFWQ